jgi:hypothetical protein
MQQDASAFVQAFSGSHRFVLDSAPSIGSFVSQSNTCPYFEGQTRGVAQAVSKLNAKIANKMVTNRVVNLDIMRFLFEGYFVFIWSDYH